MDDLLKRVEALERLAKKQGWIMQSDGTWATRQELKERENDEQLCTDCGHKNKDCECDVCFRCGNKKCNCR